jgi:lipocalin-like protein
MLDAAEEPVWPAIDDFQRGAIRLAARGRGLVVRDIKVETMQDVESRLLGTWRLVSLRREHAASGEEIPDHPRNGFITFAPGRRMMTILVWTDRTAPADEVPTDAERIALHKSLISFAGDYEIFPDRLEFTVDVSWNESWTGSRQVRFCRFEANRMMLTTEPHRSATDGVNSVFRQVWEKMD